MASAWGKSWGAAWGNSWGTVTVPTPTPAALVVAQGMLYGAPVHPPKTPKKKPRPADKPEPQKQWQTIRTAAWVGPVRVNVRLSPMRLTVRRNMQVRTGQRLEMLLGPVGTVVSGATWLDDPIAADDAEVMRLLREIQAENGA